MKNLPYRLSFFLFSLTLISCGRKDLKLKHEADALRTELKKSCIASISSIERTQLNTLTPVDTAFFRQYLEDLPLQHNELSLEKHPGASFRFIDFRENDPYIIFSVVKEDESGFRTYYYISVNTRTGERKGILLSKEGTDGIHTAATQINWINDTVLALTEISVEKDGKALLVDTMKQNVIFREGIFQFRTMKEKN